MARQVHHVGILVLALALLGLAAPAPTITVNPKTALVPLDYLRVTARIPRDADNRSFCVAAFLDEMVIRRSCGQLEGLDAAITHEWYWRELREPGDYTITLNVALVTGKTVGVSTTLTLLGGIR